MLIIWYHLKLFNNTIYFVYVIELEQVVADVRKFRTKNPKYIKGNVIDGEYGEFDIVFVGRY